MVPAHRAFLRRAFLRRALLRRPCSLAFCNSGHDFSLSLSLSLSLSSFRMPAIFSARSESTIDEPVMVKAKRKPWVKVAFSSAHRKLPARLVRPRSRNARRLVLLAALCQRTARQGARARRRHPRASLRTSASRRAGSRVVSAERGSKPAREGPPDRVERKSQLARGALRASALAAASAPAARYQRARRVAGHSRPRSARRGPWDRARPGSKGAGGAMPPLSSAATAPQPLARREPPRLAP
jgi:hypothetical protein